MRERMKLSFVFLLSLSTLLIASCTFSDGEFATVEVNVDLRFQEMTGWEATVNLPDDPSSNEHRRFRAQMMDKVVGEVGINRLRLEIRNTAEAPVEHVRRFFEGEITYDEWRDQQYTMTNDNDDPFVINPDGFNFIELDFHIEETVLPFRERLADRGEQAWINICFVAFIEGDYPLKDPEEYAEFVLATYQHMHEKYGFVPDTWEVILEPDLKEDMWSGEEIGLAIVAAGNRLQANGFEPSFIAPSVENMSNTKRYMKAIERVPGAIEYMDEVTYHRYHGQSRKHASQIAKLAQKHELKTGMLEYWFGRADHFILHEDLSIANNSSWQGRSLAGYYDLEPQGDETVLFNPREDTRYNLLYFRDVRIGAVRIGAATVAGGGVDPIAFENPDGSTTVIVRSDRAKTIEITGLPEGLYRTSFATQSGSNEGVESKPLVAEEALIVSIPAAGVLSVTSRTVQ